MAWVVVIAICAMVLGGWVKWLETKKAGAAASGSLRARVDQNALELQAAQKRIANLEAIVVNSLEEASEPIALPLDDASEELRTARLASRLRP